MRVVIEHIQYGIIVYNFMIGCLMKSVKSRALANDIKLSWINLDNSVSSMPIPDSRLRRWFRYL